ncbi:odorant receptor 13a [Diachasma alloeum]|uniref:Odorant receptor n=1 Tax=Diachasma alloeum TaxID=454923 RepID=A0A4E0RQV0_9HYME|nr:odorant receptor 13a [Diachasma alloeum]THK33204.1 odorant receptor 199 [Diachasma alloeum]
MPAEIRDINENKLIDEDFIAAGNLLTWLKWFCTIGGLWPLEKTYIRAGVWTVYLTLHLVMEYVELFAAFGNFNATVFSVVEVSMQTMVYAKLIVFRHSAMLRRLIDATKDELAENLYENYEEKKLYLKYNSLSKLYYKVSVPYVMTAACVYYLRPVVTSLLIGNFGTNDSMVLPFHITLPYTIVDTRVYWMTYAYLSPMIYLLACHNGWICVLITVQLHICGQLTIVEHRIRNIVHVTDHDASHAIFKSLVDRHTKSIWMAKSFDDSFHFILLVDLIVMTLLLGLTSYVIIIGQGVSESSTGPVFGIAGTATLLLIYGYCIVGESLISESSKVHAAYYECMWYESSADFKKAVMICMLSSQEPLRMTAGKFFVFSLTSFTDILKTAMGYVSLLRKVSQ